MVGGNRGERAGEVPTTIRKLLGDFLTSVKRKLTGHKLPLYKLKMN